MKEFRWFKKPKGAPESSRQHTDVSHQQRISRAEELKRTEYWNYKVMEQARQSSIDPLQRLDDKIASALNSLEQQYDVIDSAEKALERQYEGMGRARQSSIDPLEQQYDKIESEYRSFIDFMHNPLKIIDEELGKLKAMLRTIPPDRDSPLEVRQSYEATERIAENVSSIRDEFLASHLNQEACQKITFLVSLASFAYEHYKYKAVKLSDRSKIGKKPIDEYNDNSLDKRSKKEIKRALAFYLEIDNIIGQCKKFVNREGEQLSPDKILASLDKFINSWLKHADTQVKAINDSFTSRDTLIYYEYDIPRERQSSEEQAIRDAWERMKELAPELPQSRSAAKPEDLISLIKYRNRVGEYVSLYEDHIKKTQYGQSSYIEGSKRMKRFIEYTNNLEGREVLPSQQATTDTASMWSRISQFQFRKMHHYAVFLPICDVGGDTTLDNLFERSKHQRSFVTITWDKESVTTGSETKILMMLGGAVKHTVDDKNHSAVQITLRGHPFHPGAFRVTPVQRGNKLGMVVEAVANSFPKKVHKKSARFVWGLTVGRRMKKEVNRVGDS